MENTMQQIGVNKLTDEDIRRYKAIGFEFARDSSADTAIIRSGLDKVLALFRTDTRDDTARQIRKLKADIGTFKSRKVDEATLLETVKLEVDAKKEEISYLKAKRDGLRSETHDTRDRITIGLQIFCLIALFFFLYVFYASIGYAVLDEVKRASSTLLNADVFWEAGKKGAGALIRVLFIPMVVLAFGLLIDYAIRKIREAEGKKKVLWTLLFMGFLSVAFCFDVIAGYKICQNMHLARFDAEEIQIAWHVTLVFKDINFYLVLILGFVGYLAWGLLLHMFLSNPSLSVRDKERQLDKKIEESKSELLEIEQRIKKTQGNLEKLVEAIETMQLDLNFYESGGIKYYKSKLRGVVGAFMEGYSTYVVPSCIGDEEKARSIMASADLLKQNWENEADQTLTYENE